MNKLTFRRNSTFFLFLMLGAITACETKKTDAATAASTGITSSSLTAKASAKVANIVFVTKEHPCDCTRKRIDTAEAALQQVLGNPAKIPVQTLKADLEPEKLEPYRQQKPAMALPAIYLLDGKNVVLELLQGEITAEQLSNALSPHNG